MLDLTLWLNEWQDLIARHGDDAAESSNLQLNLRVQHAWGSMALHLRALSASGIENIAIMTEQQRTLATSAKVSNAYFRAGLLRLTALPGCS